MELNYELLAGTFPTDITDLILVVDENNQLDYAILESLGFVANGVERIDFDDIVGTEFQLVTNNDFFVETEMGNFLPNQDLNISDWIDFKVFYGDCDYATC